MQGKIIFQSKNEEGLFLFLKFNKQRKCLNFLNQHDLYQAAKLKKFRDILLKKDNLNVIDGFFVSAYLSFLNLKKVSRIRGPTLTKDFLSNPSFSRNKKHFFIGLEADSLRILKEKFPHLKKSYCYNPPYIKDLEFPKQEIEEITKEINRVKPDYTWVGIACPKQNILTDSLFRKTKVQYFFNVGAGIDFLLGKKKEAPKIFRNLGIEWFYRLLTDFKYSKKKVWRSFLGVCYLLARRVKVGLEE